ncbi:DUF4340 domain-containing protein [Limobrevibacterium gyesilva]|uniref:DUF4340 domain-containing protein n=1 Tax=Limobrevibacterium gyesilva TaxID=2991712 RepID=A0AA41YI19_9PROT|nr:DUF4340 domain-containing protein [Limobrevibacterium gyesilva]MCW3473864.1 DUF4340 domain-containing protein [Limobrevibacterium gyesilva]
MKPRNTLILAAVAAAALAAGWQFGLRTTPVGQMEVAPGSLVFPGLAAKLQDARRIEVTHQGKTMVIAQENGKWGLADRGGFPVQADKLRELLTGLTELRITEPRTSDPAQYSRLGVEDAQPPTSNSNLLRVLDSNGKPIAELIVGHRRVRTQGNVPESIYVRRPGEAGSWLAEGRLPVDADPQLWFDRDIANIDHARIATIEVKRGDATLEFGRDGDKLTLKSPAEHPKLDEYRLEDIGRGLEALTLTDVKPAAQQSGEKIGTAVMTTTDGLKVTVTVFKADKDIWAQFAATGEDKAKAEAEALQARVAGWTYQVGSWKEKAFVPTLDDLKASEPAPAAATPQPGSPPADDAAKPAVQ